MLLLPQRPKRNPVINIDKTIAGRDALSSFGSVLKWQYVALVLCSMDHRIEDFRSTYTDYHYTTMIVASN